MLLTCDADNEASRRTRIKNGGVLENRVECEAALSRCGMIQRYWITLKPEIKVKRGSRPAPLFCPQKGKHGIRLYV